LTEVRQHRFHVGASLDAGDQCGPFVDPAEQGAVVDNVPEAVRNLLETDVLVTERIAEEGLRGVEPEGTGSADAPDFEMSRVLRRSDPRGIGVRRGHPARGGDVVVDPLVGALLVVAAPEGVELPLLAPQAVRGRAGRLALQLAVLRSWVPFSCGLAG
jgi:hypothetical protein